MWRTGECLKEGKFADIIVGNDIMRKSVLRSCFHCKHMSCVFFFFNNAIHHVECTRIFVYSGRRERESSFMKMGSQSRFKPTQLEQTLWVGDTWQQSRG